MLLDQEEFNLRVELVHRGMLLEETFLGDREVIVVDSKCLFEDILSNANELASYMFEWC